MYKTTGVSCERDVRNSEKRKRKEKMKKVVAAVFTAFTTTVVDVEVYVAFVVVDEL